MFDHVGIRASDRAASERFYETVLTTLGIEVSTRGESYVEWDDFSLATANAATRMMAAKPPTRRLHVAFVAPSREHVDEFWRVGSEAGYRDDGAPGPRPQYRDDYYGSFLLDPDGNSAEAVVHGNLRRGGVVDHLWIRVADVSASNRFYEAVGAHAGFTARIGTDERGFFVGSTGSFSIVAGEPTTGLHMAFPAPDDAAVDAFHRALTDLGYRDDGPPGERAVYHPGYYGAFVLDPVGNSVELVNHNWS